MQDKLSNLDESIQIPHFEIDLSMDGVQLFNNSEKSECIPICFLVHSLSKCYGSSSLVHLKTRHPIIIGVFHGTGKPNVHVFLAPLLEELKRLDPLKSDLTTRGREFTVSLRCVIADWPMRSYLKKV